MHSWIANNSWKANLSKKKKKKKRIDGPDILQKSRGKFSRRLIYTFILSFSKNRVLQSWKWLPKESICMKRLILFTLRKMFHNGVCWSFLTSGPKVNLYFAAICSKTGCIKVIVKWRKLPIARGLYPENTTVTKLGPRLHKKERWGTQRHIWGEGNGVGDRLILVLLWNSITHNMWTS